MEFEIEVSNYRCFTEENPLRLVMQPGVTAIIGANSSGKSAVLKLFYELRHLFSSLSNPHGMKEFFSRKQLFDVAPSVKDINSLFSFENTDDLVLKIKPLDPGGPLSLVVLIQRGERTAQIAFERKGEQFGFGPESVEIGSGAKIAIPEGVFELGLLQTLADHLSDTMYIPAYRNIVNVGGNSNYYDAAIGQQFVTTWKSYKTGDNIANRRIARSITKDIQQLLRFESLEIDSSESEESLQLIVDDHPLRLEEVGSGIAQLILVLVNAAIKNPRYILLDEPELNLHPTLQLDFLTTLASYAKDGIIFATHSYGLARSAADRIYATQQTSTTSSTLSVYEDVPEPATYLGALGFPSYEQLGYKTVLLVEGPTEVRTFHQVLRLYGLDHKVVLLPIHGRELIHKYSESQLIETRRLCSEMRCIIDSDRDEEGGKADERIEDFAAICEKLKIPICVTKLRATENYFPQDAIDKAFPGLGVTALGPYDKAPKNWKKRNNWRIARRMKLEDWDNTDVGDFLKKLGE